MTSNGWVVVGCSMAPAVAILGMYYAAWAMELAVAAVARHW
jgi:hypothetical protein